MQKIGRVSVPAKARTDLLRTRAAEANDDSRHLALEINARAAVRLREVAGLLARHGTINSGLPPAGRAADA
jgi:hypothetical protein